MNSESQHSWLITFSDLMLLLLTFFVMRYAMLRGEPQGEPPPARNFEIEMVRDRLDQILAQQPGQDIQRNQSEDSITLTLTNLFTESDPEELSFKGKVFLSGLSTLRNSVEFRISTFSSLSRLPGGAPISPSQLSLRQTNEIVRQMIDTGVPPESISAFGYGSYQGVAGSGTEPDQPRVEIEISGFDRNN